MTAGAADLIRSAITRIPIPPGQITLFKALYENPEGDEKSLTGVLAALTNRVNGTPGLDTTKPGLQFLIERDASRDGVYYRLRPETRSVIQTLPRLRDAMAKSVNEIRFLFADETSWLVL
jgi:hypothetical protein